MMSACFTAFIITRKTLGRLVTGSMSVFSAQKILSRDALASGEITLDLS